MPDAARQPSTAGLVPACPICGTPGADFRDYNGGHRRLCPGCRSLERQRALAAVYPTMRREFDFVGKSIVVVAPSESKRRWLREQGITNVRSLDVRPEIRSDIIADVCAMPHIPDACVDAVIASGVLVCTHDLDAALAEFHRILRPGGRLLTCDPVTFGAPTVEHADLDTITAWYGREAYDTHKVGLFREFGDLDLIRTLSTRFVVKTYYHVDEPSDILVAWHASVKG